MIFIQNPAENSRETNLDDMGMVLRMRDLFSNLKIHLVWLKR